MGILNEAASPLRILVADDNPDAVLALRLLLEQDGHIVHTMPSGARVVEAVREFKPDVCLLDIQMPGESGYAIARELREEYGVTRPVLIAISGVWYKASDQLLALSCGFDHFLEKPADPADLARLLGDIGRRRAAA
jgi:CheY-like chemotaxis protein